MIFLREVTKSDHIRLLYKFERDKKNMVVLGVVDMCQLLSNVFYFNVKNAIVHEYQKLSYRPVIFWVSKTRSFVKETAKL